MFEGLGLIELLNTLEVLTNHAYQANVDGVERNFRHDELSKRHFGEGKGQIFEAGRDEHTIEQPAHSSRVLFDLLSENHVHTVVLVPLEHPIFYEVPYPKKTDDCSTQS